MNLKNQDLAPHLCKALKISEEDISLEAIADLKVLPIIGNKDSHISLKELGDFKHMRELTTLVLAFCDFSDLSPLQSNQVLVRMQIVHCGLIDLKPLSSLRNVKEFVLSDNDIKKLDGLESHQLMGIVLKKNNIFDISPLENQTKMKYLILDYNPLMDISAIEKLLNLEELSMAGCADENSSLFEDQLFYLSFLGNLESLNRNKHLNVEQGLDFLDS